MAASIKMKIGFVLPFGDARTTARLAHQAELAGWDGFFVWEPVWGIDAWVSLAAAAMRTEHIRLGTMLTPLSRMRPWKLASETATLDNLSGGRVILSVGLGAIDTGFGAFGEVTDRSTRAQLLDEGLEILTGLWRGQPFHYHGKHYQVSETDFYPPPPPLQQPRIPIWVVGLWGAKKSMDRALRYDGLLPAVRDANKDWRQLTPDDVRQIKSFVAANVLDERPFDIVVEGQTFGEQPDQAAAKVLTFAEAGATWWIDGMWQIARDSHGLDQVEGHIKAGPPVIGEG